MASNSPSTSSATPKSAEERAAILANPGFGDYFTDHTAVVDYSVDADGNGGWHDARIEPYGPISLDPSAAVLHYGQEIFEGLKAYRHADGSIWTFRPEANAARLNKSARRLALPGTARGVLPRRHPRARRRGQGLGSLRRRRSPVPAPVHDRHRGVPGRPAGPRGLLPRDRLARPATTSAASSSRSPSGSPRDYARAGRGGTGAAKCGGNYAASLVAQQEAEAHGCKQVLFLDQFNDNAVEELGGMNVFFVMKDGSLVTPALTGTILRGRHPLLRDPGWPRTWAGKSPNARSPSTSGATALPPARSPRSSPAAPPP